MAPSSGRFGWLILDRGRGMAVGAPLDQPRPASPRGTPSSGRQRPLRPAVPPLGAAVAARAARGRAGPRVGAGPCPSPPPRPVVPGGRAPDAATGRDPLRGAAAGPAENRPRAPGMDLSPSNPLTHLQKKASRRLPAQRHLQGTALAPRLDGGAEWPPVPASLPEPPTSSPLPAGAPRRAHPAALGVQPPPPGCHQARGQTAAPHLRPRGRARPQPLPAPRDSAGPRRALTTHQLCDPPRLAARRSSRRQTRLGALQVTLAHPFPEETLAGRGTRGGGSECGAHCTAAGRAPCRGAALAPPGGRGVAPPPPRDAPFWAAALRTPFGATRRFSPAAAA